MPVDFAKLDAHLSSAMAHWPDSVEINGETYATSKVSLSRGSVQLLNDMHENSYQLSLQIQVSEVGSDLPKIEGLVTYDGTVYRVIDVSSPSANLEVRLDLGNKYAR